MRILLVSQMYPGPSAPDLGVFVKQVADELGRRGHELRRAVLDYRGGPSRHARLGRAAVAEARRFRPDVVYGHFLFPAGGAAALAAAASGAALVQTAHGGDVRNLGAVPGVATATRLALSHAGAVIAVSEFLRAELVAKLPALAGRVHVVDCGVDLGRFREADPAAARRALGWDGAPPYFLCVGALDERKNVLRLAEAFSRLEGGTLVFVGDGPLRPLLAGRDRVRLAGRVPHEEVPRWIAACDVLCQPSLMEPFGQAILEGLAVGRPVLATRIGGPPEFVRPGTGVLVDPGSVDAIEAGLRAAAELPVPNEAARAVAAEHELGLQAARIEEILLAAAAQ